MNTAGWIAIIVAAVASVVQLTVTILNRIDRRTGDLDKRLLESRQELYTEINTAIRTGEVQNDMINDRIATYGSDKVAKLWTSYRNSYSKDSSDLRQQIRKEMSGSLSVESSKKAADRRFYVFITLLIVVLTACRYEYFYSPNAPRFVRSAGSIHIYFLSLGLYHFIDPVLHWIHPL
jgi:hypothetical protein